MVEEFNLIISTRRGEESEASSEAWYLLREIGDPSPDVRRTNVAGLLVAKTSLNPFEAVSKLRELLRERPWDFRHMMRVIPIEVVVKADVGEIASAVEGLAQKIAPSEKFRVTVEKRHTSLSSMEVIKAAADKVDRKVDLENPDKVVLIEIIGPVAGVSVISPSDILAVQKEKAAE